MSFVAKVAHAEQKARILMIITQGWYQGAL